MARIHQLAESQKILKVQMAGHFMRYATRIGANLVKAGFFIQRESMKLVPIWQGNLRDSAFTEFTGTGLQTEVRVGYKAAYALFVHEILEYAHGDEFNIKHADKIAKMNYTKKVKVEHVTINGTSTRTKTQKVTHAYYFNRGPNQQAKFLTRAISDNAAAISAILNSGLT